MPKILGCIISSMVGLKRRKGTSDGQKKISNFLLGLFVTRVLLAFSSWLPVGAGKFFEKGKKYVSYFSESVQGLDKDSEVRFRGVKVGRVENIFIAPDDRHVGILMSIDLKFDPTKEAIAQLQMTGITGVLYVNLNPEKGPRILLRKISLLSRNTR